MNNGIGSLLGMQADVRAFKQDSRWVLPNCRVGVECEFENAGKKLPPLAAEMQYWAHHKEDSLRGQGAEYVFANPMFGEDAYRAIEWMVTEAKKLAYKCSIRTGLHVHVDVRDMDIDQFKTMSLAYSVIEPILYRWVGDNREESVYCVPWYYADKTVEEAVAIFKAMLKDSKATTIGKEYMLPEGKPTTLAGWMASKYERYAGYNLNSLYKFGSVEYRHMQMTLELPRIIDWINIIMSIKQFGMTYKQDVYEVTKRITPIDFLNRVLGGRLSNQLIDSCKGDLTSLYRTGLQSLTDIKHLLTSDKSDWGPKLPASRLGKPKGTERYLKRIKERQPAIPKAPKVKINGPIPPAGTLAHTMYMQQLYDQMLHPSPNTTTTINWHTPPPTYISEDEVIANYDGDAQ